MSLQITLTKITKEEWNTVPECDYISEGWLVSSHVSRLGEAPRKKARNVMLAAIR